MFQGVFFVLKLYKDKLLYRTHFGDLVENLFLSSTTFCQNGTLWVRVQYAVLTCFANN